MDQACCQDMSYEKYHKRIAVVILGRKVLKSIGWEHRRIIEADSERRGRIMKISKALEKNDSNEGAKWSIATLFANPMVHNATTAGEDGINDMFEYTKVQVDSQGDKDTDVTKRIDEAVAQGLRKRNNWKTFGANICQYLS